MCIYLSEATFEECGDLVSRPGGVQVAQKTRCFIMYTSISGSGRPSLGVCSLDYAGELHKRGIQRVKVRLRGGGDASARGDFRVPFPGDTLASCEP